MYCYGTSVMNYFVFATPDPGYNHKLLVPFIFPEGIDPRIVYRALDNVVGDLISGGIVQIKADGTVECTENEDLPIKSDEINDAQNIRNYLHIEEKHIQPSITKEVTQEKYDKKKYIIVERHGFVIPIIFTIDKSFKYMHDKFSSQWKIISAGYVIFEDNKISVVKNSKSITPIHPKEDLEVLNSYFHF